MSIIFTGDCHFRNNIISRLTEVIGDTEKVIQEIKKVCLDDRAKTNDTALIFGGDVFDVKTPPPHIVLLVKNLVTELKENNITSYYITGNHEANYCHGQEWGDVLGCVPLHGKVMTVCGVKVYGINNLKRDELLEAIEAIPAETEVLVLHQALKDALSFVSSTGEISWNLEKEDIPEHIKIVLLADIHITESYTTDTAIFVYPGSLVSTSITEENNKYVVSVDPADLDVIDYIPVPTRKIISKTIITEKGFIKLYTSLKKLNDPDQALKPVYVINYDISIPAGPLFIEKIRGLDGYHVLAVPIHRSQDNSVTVNAYHELSDISLVTCLSDFLEPGKDNDSEVMDFLTDFINSESRTAFIQEYKNNLK